MKSFIPQEIGRNAGLYDLLRTKAPLLTAEKVYGGKPCEQSHLDLSFLQSLRLSEDLSTQTLVFQVVGLNFVSVKEKDVGIFSPSECYTIVHIKKGNSEENGNIEVEMWNWIGSVSEMDKRFSVAVYSSILRDMIGLKTPIGRTEEGNESKDFIDIWEGKFVVSTNLALKTDTALRKSTLSVQSPMLYILRNCEPYAMRLIDIYDYLVLDCYSYILHTSDGVYSWSGKDCSFVINRTCSMLSSILSSNDKNPSPVEILSREEFIGLINRYSSSYEAGSLQNTDKHIGLPDYVPSFATSLKNCTNAHETTESSSMRERTISKPAFVSCSNSDFHNTNNMEVIQSDLTLNSKIAMASDSVIDSGSIYASLDAYDQQCELYLLPDDTSNLTAENHLILKCKFLPRTSLTSDNCYVIDIYSELFLWIGLRASASLKSKSLGFLSSVIALKCRPKCVRIHRISEGAMSARFRLLLESPFSVYHSTSTSLEIDEKLHLCSLVAEDIVSGILQDLDPKDIKLSKVEDTDMVNNLCPEDSTFDLISFLKYSNEKRAFVASRNYTPGHFHSDDTYLLILSRSKKDSLEKSSQPFNDIHSGSVSQVYSYVQYQYSFPFWVNPLAESNYYKNSKFKDLSLLRHSIEIGSSSNARWKSLKCANFVIYAWFGLGSKLSAYVQARINAIPILHGIINTLYESSPALLVNFEAHAQDEWDNHLFHKAIYHCSKFDAEQQCDSNRMITYYITSKKPKTAHAREFRHSVTGPVMSCLKTGDALLVIKGASCMLLYDSSVHTEGCPEIFLETTRDISSSIFSHNQEDPSPPPNIVVIDLNNDAACDPDNSNSSVYNGRQLEVSDAIVGGDYITEKERNDTYNEGNNTCDNVCTAETVHNTFKVASVFNEPDPHSVKNNRASVEETVIIRVFSIYMLKIISTIINPIFWAQVKLSPNSCTIITNTNKGKLWLWVGREVSKFSESFARDVVNSVSCNLKEGFRESVVCMEGEESNEFKSLFSDWLDLSLDMKCILSLT